MAMFKFYLDTDALNRLSNLNGKKLEEFKKRFNSIDAELVFTHVQVGERYSTKDEQKYQEIVEKAKETLRSKGIQIRFENTKIGIFGISRWGFFCFFNFRYRKNL
jgi:alanine-alpha-ketoisovalerate/valine-pyruvate aminotransferase